MKRRKTKNYSTGRTMNLSTSQHLLNVHRKSFIGRSLERSSFQDQRLSDVGVAFGQQITARVGLKLPASQERIIEQTRWLYLRYVFVKLRQNSLPLRDLNLTKTSRQRRAAILDGSKTEPATPSIVVPSIQLPNSRQLSRRRTRGPEQLFSVVENNVAIGTNGTTGIAGNGAGGLGSSSSSTSGSSSINNNRKFVMDPTINNQIFNVIWSIIRELRDAKPELFGDTIYELIGLDKFSSLQNLLNIQLTICQEMIRSDISWCRIVALFSLFGAMSLDCVRLGAPEHVGPILDGFIEFVERDLALWISQQGGWESFLYKYRPDNGNLTKLASKLIVVLVPLAAVLLCLQCKEII